MGYFDQTIKDVLTEIEMVNYFYQLFKSLYGTKSKLQSYLIL